MDTGNLQLHVSDAVNVMDLMPRDQIVIPRFESFSSCVDCLM